LRYTVTKEVSFYPGDPLSLLDAFITAPSGGTNYEQQIVIFGLDEDPLLPFEGKFDRALRAIERLGALKLRCLCIQTRSPLIMLCCPILRTLGQSALVSMHIETRSDKIAKQIYPLLPRPSERLEAARALKKLNIPVNLVCSPPNFERGLERYANAAAAAAHWIQISNSAAQATASRLLGKHLKQIAPGKVNIIPDLLYADASTKPGALSAD
jgi:DNA repair photolyase